MPDISHYNRFSMSSRRALRPNQSLIQSVEGVLSVGIERPERETDHLPQTSAEARKT
jgi:hypothetical protein